MITESDIEMFAEKLSNNSTAGIRLVFVTTMTSLVTWSLPCVLTFPVSKFRRR